MPWQQTKNRGRTIRPVTMERPGGRYTGRGLAYMQMGGAAAAADVCHRD